MGKILWLLSNADGRGQNAPRFNHLTPRVFFNRRGAVVTIGPVARREAGRGVY
jgi:hypothetical protein